MMKKQFLVFIFLLTTSFVSAQLYEVGGFIGGSNYIGDIGPTQYINPNRIAVGAIAKFNYSPRITFRGSVIYTKLHAADKYSNNDFRQNRGLEFNNKLVDAAIGIEFSFFKYSMSKVGFSQTPYIIAQIGTVTYNGLTEGPDPGTVDSKIQTSLVVPFGIGYKMRLAENVGIAFETSFRYTFKDEIDGNLHSIPGLDFGNPNSDDWYVFTGVTIVYAFGRPGCYSGEF